MLFYCTEIALIFALPLPHHVTYRSLLRGSQHFRRSLFHCFQYTARILCRSHSSVVSTRLFMSAYPPIFDRSRQHLNQFAVVHCVKVLLSSAGVSSYAFVYCFPAVFSPPSVSIYKEVKSPNIFVISKIFIKKNAYYANFI